MSTSIIAPATLRITRTCANEDGLAHNPTSLVFTVSKGDGTHVGTYIAGEDPEVVVTGVPDGTYILEITLSDAGHYRIVSTQAWTMEDGQSAVETQVTEEDLNNG